MRCKECEKLLPDYLSGLLSESDQTAVLEHSADCPKCGREIENLQLLFSGRTSASGRKDIDFSNFIAHVNNKIDVRAHSATRRFLLPALAAPAIAAILILVLLNPFDKSDTWMEDEDFTFLEELVDLVSTSQLIEFEQLTVFGGDVSVHAASASTVPESMFDEIDNELSDVLMEGLSLSNLLASNGDDLSSDELLELLSDTDHDALLAVLTETVFTID